MVRDDGAEEKILVRPETPDDREAVRRVHELAFEQPDEARLVDALRAAGDAAVSLVAARDGAVVGHIVFSPVRVEGAGGAAEGDRGGLVLGLAPMAVLPALQRRGVGGRLVRDGLARCRRLGAVGVVVLGHAEYYPRFGFVPASRFGLTSTYDVPDEVFMALELVPGALAESRRDGARVVRYAPAFDAL